MSNLQKFNTILEEFDKEIGRLKSVSEIYQKIEGLITSYHEILTLSTENNQILGEINQSYTAHRQQAKDEFLKLIEDRMDLLQKENKSFYHELEGTIKIKLEDNKSEIKRLIEYERSQIKDIFEIEFDKNSQDIKKFTGTELTKQTQDLKGFVDTGFKENTKEIKSYIQTELDKQVSILLAQQKILKISVWGLGAVLLILSILTIFKIWS